MSEGGSPGSDGEEVLFVDERPRDLSPEPQSGQESRDGDGNAELGANAEFDANTGTHAEDSAELEANKGANATESADVNTPAPDPEHALPPTGFARPKLDPVQLASILKDFDAVADPLFAGLPNYFAAIVKELLEGDFLLVLGRGLGLAQVLRLFLAKVKQASPNALVLVLGRRQGADDDDDGADPGTGSKPVEEFSEDDTIGFNVNAAKRAKLYQQGGIYHITAPIAVVDILTGVLDCSTVSGLIVAHGESVSEHSTAAFFIRLLRDANPRLFIKALSDAPERLVLPPALPLRLRVLGVPTVMLWPRFHLAVDRSLPRLDVDEIIVEQTPAVRRQQALLTELTQAVLSDVKRRIPHLDVEFLDPALGSQQPQEDAEKLHASTTADTVLSAPDLPWRIRNALQGVWHKLSRDGRRSVYSLGTLQQLQHTLMQFDSMAFWSQLDFAYREGSEPWVGLPAADMLVAEARREAVLHRKPAKFSHLRDILADTTASDRVLVLFSSPKSVYELYNFLSSSREEQQHNDDLSRALEESMRAADEENARKRAEERAAKVNEGRPGRRRVRGGKAPTPGRASQPTETADPEMKQEVPEDAGGSSNNHSTAAASTVSAEVPPLKRKYEEIDLTGLPEESGLDNMPMHIPTCEATVTLGTYRGAKPLSVVQPTHVIMYDPDLQFTREIERYAATIPKGQPKVLVHFMYYQRSVEELQYLTEMRREKDAFTKLIREKGLMPMVLRDGDQPGGGSEDIRVLGNSRRGYQATRARQRIVVDTREFRSALPFLIWQSHVDVVPVTLLVGDYILTPDIVVERKSINDLIGSFRDGRLYAQCESMHQHYKTAVLLVEFDSLSNFSMEPFRDVRSRQSADVQQEIQENLSALLLRFPKLKLIWSASPIHSAQIFKGLKEMEPDPEPEECAKAGQSVLFDSVALSMLEALPGITPGNAHLLAKRASALTDVCKLSRQEIVDALGPENGDKLYRFISERKPDVSLA